RKSQEWEAEIQTIDAERARMQQPGPAVLITAEKILELAKQAEFLYKTQDPTEQRRLLENVLSNCTFDRGTLCPTYSKPFDLFVEGNKTGNWRREWDSNLCDSFDSVSYRFQNPSVAANAAAAVDPCTLLHASRACLYCRSTGPIWHILVYMARVEKG